MERSERRSRYVANKRCNIILQYNKIFSLESLEGRKYKDNRESSLINVRDGDFAHAPMFERKLRNYSLDPQANDFEPRRCVAIRRSEKLFLLLAMIPQPRLQRLRCPSDRWIRYPQNVCSVRYVPTAPAVELPHNRVIPGDGPKAQMMIFEYNHAVSFGLGNDIIFELTVSIDK